MKLYLEPLAKATQSFLEAKASALPANQALLSLAILLNNRLVVLLASIGSLALILLVTWGRKTYSYGKNGQVKIQQIFRPVHLGFSKAF